MEWSKVINIIDLDVCPVCNQSNKIETLRNSEIRVNRQCECGCRFYQTTNRTWFSFDISFDLTKKVDLSKYMEISKN